MNKKVLIIGFVWPEPNATAAGTRMLQLIHFFLDEQYEVSFASAAKKTDLSVDLDTLNVKTKDIQLNDSSFDVYAQELDPEIVVFDRFLTEEQYGWRIREVCPLAIRILDTEDLHFLRKARETAGKQENNDFLSFVKNDTAKREIASIYRSDLSLIISKVEEKLLYEEFKIDRSLLLYLPFLIEKNSKEGLSELPGFSERHHFMTMGNFKHQPNWDSVLYLKQDIWPLIRKKLPDVELHVFGAYVSEKARQLNNKKDGFIIKGWASDKSEAFKTARVCLAPLRFGAGLKGKLIDAMVFGTPSITTSIGIEGIKGELPWNGFVSDEPAEIAQLAFHLYTNADAWKTAQLNGIKLLRANFDGEAYKKAFQIRIKQLTNNLSHHRERNFTGAMLSHHTLQSTKYLSKWIALKNVIGQ
jgi:glycosyltransferase involved in cell wall biosynthesis